MQRSTVMINPGEERVLYTFRFEVCNESCNGSSVTGVDPQLQLANAFVFEGLIVDLSTLSVEFTIDTTVGAPNTSFNGNDEVSLLDAPIDLDCGNCVCFVVTAAFDETVSLNYSEDLILVGGMFDAAGTCQKAGTNVSNVCLSLCPDDVQEAALCLEKTLCTDECASVGTPVTFIVTVSNKGTTPLENISMEDQFDTDFLAFVSADPAPTMVLGGVIVWNDLEKSVGSQIGSIFQPGESFTVRVTFTGTAAVDSTENLAMATANGDTVTSNTSTASVQIKN